MNLLASFRLKPGRRPRLLAAVLAAMTLAAQAEQYKSEVRELETTPAPAKPQDARKLLESTTDPYAKALMLRDLAAQAVEKKDYDQAAAYLEQAIRQNALSPQAVAEMRRSLTQLRVAGGKPEEVVRALEPQVKNNANAPAEQQVALAGAYLQLKRYKEALPLLQRTVPKHPNPDESWLRALYAAYIGVGQEKAAVPILEKLVRRNPAEADYWLQLAGLYHKAGQKDRALAMLELASRQGYVKDSEQRLQLVSLTAQAGAPFEAGSLMHAWMADEEIPRSARNWEALAALWISAREWSLAAEALRQALAIEEKADLYLQLGRIHMERGHYPDAAVALNKGLSLSGDARSAKSAPILMAIGVASYHAGNVQGARAAFEGARQIKSAEQGAQQWLAFLDSPQAEAQSRKLAQRGPPAAGGIDVVLSARLGGDVVTARPSGGIEVAAVAPDARTIGGRLTPVGAERDANGDGTIPAWTGGLTRPPAAFKRGERYVDPYPEDKPLFTISAANAAQYAGKLSAGHRALLAKYPNFRMPVYATRRSAAYPQAIYDATQANIGKAKLIGSDALTGARLGFPFPQPQNGVEVMWNHRTRYRGDSHMGITTQAVVGREGVSNVRKGVFRTLFRYANIERPADIEAENLIVQGITFVSERAGESRPEFVVLFHETANSLKKARGIWVLLGDWGKMMRLPPLGYDQVMYGTEGLYFIDMIDMYNGAFDRYVWKLVGKRELFVPYNAYRLSDGSQKYAEQLTYPTFNSKNARYELHRVWVIEATERGGRKHSFGKRIFYVDEDTWNVVLVENQDHQGRLWRFQEGHLLSSYDVLNTNSFPIVTYDFKEERYFVHRLLSEDPPLEFNLKNIESAEFLPAAVQRKYRR